MGPELETDASQVEHSVDGGEILLGEPAPAFDGVIDGGEIA